MAISESWGKRVQARMVRISEKGAYNSFWLYSVLICVQSFQTLGR